MQCSTAICYTVTYSLHFPKSDQTQLKSKDNSGNTKLAFIYAYLFIISDLRVQLKNMQTLAQTPDAIYKSGSIVSWQMKSL